MQNPLRNIPPVSDLIERPPLRQLINRVSHHVVVSGVRSFLDNLRGELQDAAKDVQVPGPSELAERIAEWILHDERPLLRPVVNATGVPLHTGLGRSPWPDEALREAQEIAAGYCSLEVDLQDGGRSQRVVAVERLLRQLTGAEAACVVNNNAAATLLTLAALAAGREVVVSRGQLVEIGGSFRLPEVMAAGGARLREVGTTNKTRVADFEAAIGDATAALMRVHTSNFRIVGFTEQVTLPDLVALGQRRNLPVIDDIGSGALLDFGRFGVTGEPVAEQSIRAGADVVLFSGDKLLGGPQCGIIVGRRSIIRQISQHPLMRALRLDKVILAGLAATLRLYRDLETVQRRVPLLSLLSASLENLQNRAERLAPQLAAAPAIAAAEPLRSHSFLGGGSVPAQELPTWCVALRPARGGVDDLAATLRLGSPAVFGRIQQDQLHFDLRSVFPAQDALLVEAVEALGEEPATDPESASFE